MLLTSEVKLLLNSQSLKMKKRTKKIAANANAFIIQFSTFPKPLNKMITSFVKIYIAIANNKTVSIFPP